jgi:putative peptidoglycan lipid II flippase
MGLAALMLSMGMLLSRVLGYLREAVIAYQQGASASTDAYNAAFLLPDLMNYFLAGGALSITFIPLFGAYLAQQREQDGWRLFSIIASIMGTVLVLGTVLAELFTEQLLSLLYPGFAPETLAQTVSMTRIVLPAQLFHYLGGLLIATLMARGRFLPATLAPLIYNLGIIVGGVLLGPWIGMHGFAVGALLGAILGPFAVPLWMTRRALHFRPCWDWRDASFLRYLWLSIPLMLGVSLTTVDEWFGRIIGASMEEGTISWLNFARRLNLVPIAVIGQATSQAALPFLARLAGEGKREELAKVLTRSTHYVLLLALCSTGLVLALAEPMVALVYERGAFGAADTTRTTLILQLFVLGSAAWGVQMLVARAFYAEQDTWTPMLASTAMTILSIPVYVGLARSLDAAGLALASSIGMSAQAVFTLLLYRRRNRSLLLARIWTSLWRGTMLGVAAGVGASAGLWLLGRLGLGTGSLTRLLELSGGGVLGLLLALALARFIVPSELSGLLEKLRRRILRKRSAAGAS